MAVMTAPQVDQLLASIMQQISNLREPVPWLKSDLRATIVAIDQWTSDNAASINQALPEVFRTTATPNQKSRMHAEVVNHRRKYGVV